MGGRVATTSARCESKTNAGRGGTVGCGPVVAPSAMVSGLRLQAAVHDPFAVTADVGQARGSASTEFRARAVPGGCVVLRPSRCRIASRPWPAQARSAER
jgi:hypothetical protein